MGIGHELLELKNTARSARKAASERSYRGAEWFLLAWLAGGLALSSSLVLVLRLVRAISPELVIGAVATLAVGVFMFYLPGLIKRADKELDRLNKIESDAAASYLNALLAEATTYGIEHGVRSERTDFMDSDYEFTSLRNGDPLDVTVREFNYEIVFMLNGERMQKPVTV